MGSQGPDWGGWNGGDAVAEPELVCVLCVRVWTATADGVKRQIVMLFARASLSQHFTQPGIWRISLQAIPA